MGVRKSLLLVVMTLGSLRAVGAAPAEVKDVRAKDLFYRPQEAPSGATALSIRHDLFLTRGAHHGPVPDDFTFSSGDRIRLNVMVNQSGYLYVLHRGSSGAWHLLFPHHDDATADHAVTALRPQEIPKTGWFEFDDRPGTEQLFLIFSKRRIEAVQPLTHSNERTAESIIITDAIVQNIITKNSTDHQSSVSKNIYWTPETSSTATPAPPRTEQPAHPVCVVCGGNARCRPSEAVATYTTCVSPTDSGCVIRTLSLRHIN
jgi:hypothetical protein